MPVLLLRLPAVTTPMLWSELPGPNGWDLPCCQAPPCSVYAYRLPIDPTDSKNSSRYRCTPYAVHGEGVTHREVWEVNHSLTAQDLSRIAANSYQIEYNYRLSSPS